MRRAVCKDKSAPPGPDGARRQQTSPTRTKQSWAREQIRMAVGALHRDGAPLAELTQSQISALCGKWMREQQGKLKTEIPSPRSFERHLPSILAEVLAGSPIG
jgi:hypothetical protein